MPNWRQYTSTYTPYTMKAWTKQSSRLVLVWIPGTASPDQSAVDLHCITLSILSTFHYFNFNIESNGSQCVQYICDQWKFVKVSLDFKCQIFECNMNMVNLDMKCCLGWTTISSHTLLRLRNWDLEQRTASWLICCFLVMIHYLQLTFFKERYKKDSIKLCSSFYVKPFKSC